MKDGSWNLQPQKGPNKDKKCISTIYKSYSIQYKIVDAGCKTAFAIHVKVKSKICGRQALKELNMITSNFLKVYYSKFSLLQALAAVSLLEFCRQQSACF